jgi:hypothetical protein
MSILAWSVIAITLLATKSPRWPLYLGSWTIGSCLEITICVVTAVAQPNKGAYMIAVVVIHALRVSFLISLSLASLVTSVRTKTERDIERQLLHNGLENCRPYGTISHEQEIAGFYFSSKATSANKQVKEQGWWRYLQGFLILLPHIWPSKDRRTQLWIAVMALHLIKDRVLNVLIPRQVGILTDSLTLGGPFSKYLCCQFVLCIC